MKKELKTVDKKRGIIQITTVDERFYAFPSVNKITGLPEYEFIPSVTYILTAMNKGKGFETWLKTQGDNADEIKIAAANKGSRIHHAITALINGASISIDAMFPDSVGLSAPLTADEYAAVCTFSTWHKSVKPEYIASEFIVRGDGYAGTVDISCQIKGVPYIIDIKSGQGIYESYVVQLSAYKHATPIGIEPVLDISGARLAILQVGYNRCKDGYKFTEVKDKYEVFCAVKKVFDNEHGDARPRQIDLPLMVNL